MHYIPPPPRRAPAELPTALPVGTVRVGADGKEYVVRAPRRGTLRWARVRKLENRPTTSAEDAHER